MLGSCLIRRQIHFSIPLRISFVYPRQNVRYLFSNALLPYLDCRNDNLAVAERSSRSFTYSNLMFDALQLANRLPLHPQLDKPVAICLSNSYQYVVALFAVWMRGRAALPLFPFHPKQELRYFLNDSQSELIITNSRFSHLFDVEDAVVIVEDRDSVSLGPLSTSWSDGLSLDPIDSNSDALIIYTSGTTGRPKGVVHTYKSLHSQVRSIRKAWEVDSEDVILHTLPLNHVHGIVNALLAVISAGGCVEFLDMGENSERLFDAERVWDRLAARDKPQVTSFMGVPKMYSSLLSKFNQFQSARQEQIVDSLTGADSKFRLFVSGSSALPSSLSRRWNSTVGHPILERYGMTEVGMALTQPYRDGRRIPGTVGGPFPGVSLRIWNEELECPSSSGPGQLQVKGESVFNRYLNNPAATAKEFTKDGWFKTGDIVDVVEEGAFRILGRESMDILKVKGFKISALEIEHQIASQPHVYECAVVGAPIDTDCNSGDVDVCAFLSVERGFDEQDLRRRLNETLPRYKVPKHIAYLPQIPRNAMGKVDKKKLSSMKIHRKHDK